MSVQKRFEEAEKKVHQAFEIKMGIEKFSVAVPERLAEEFELKVKATHPKNQIELLELLKPFKGKII